MGDGEAKYIARAALSIKAIKLSPDKPFVWASGYQMPIYNDNRLFLSHHEHRTFIKNAFVGLIEEGIPYDVIAGTSTAGIAPGALVADKLGAPFVYVRDKPKDHGLRNRIEGVGAEEGLHGKRVIVIEDLISTGGSSADAVQGVREAGGQSDWCLSIFSYGLSKADEAFAALDPVCNVRSLLNYDQLLAVAREERYITAAQERMLSEWRADPFGWGEKHGFPKVEKRK